MPMTRKARPRARMRFQVKCNASRTCVVDTCIALSDLAQSTRNLARKSHTIIARIARNACFTDQWNWHACCAYNFLTS